MTVVAEHNVRLLEAPIAFDIHLVVLVDEDVGNGTIREQCFERTEAKQLIQNFDDEAFAFGEAERFLC